MPMLWRKIELAQIKLAKAIHRTNGLFRYHLKTDRKRGFVLVLETRGPDHIQEIRRGLRKQGYSIRRTS